MHEIEARHYKAPDEVIKSIIYKAADWISKLFYAV